MKELSVIIVSYKSDAVLMDCLQSISLHNDLANNLEVIIVDNYGGTDLEERINSNPYTFEVRYLKNPQNIGFGAANNVGVKAASSDIVFFLNPDTIIQSSIFRDIVSKIECNKNLVYGFTLVDKCNNASNSYSFFYDDYFVYHFLTIYKRLSFYGVNTNKFANKNVWPWGAAFAIHKSAFINAGMFDERIFLCNEEPDLLHRIPDREVFISKNRIIHLEGHGEVVSVLRYSEYLKSLNYYLEKYNISKRLWRLHMYLYVVKLRFMKKDASSRNFCLAWNESSKLR